MTIKWEDAGGRKRPAYEANINGVRISLFVHINNPDVWSVSCHQMYVDQHDTGVAKEDLELAKKAALVIVEGKARDLAATCLDLAAKIREESR